MSSLLKKNHSYSKKKNEKAIVPSFHLLPFIIYYFFFSYFTLSIHFFLFLFFFYFFSVYSALALLIIIPVQERIVAHGIHSSLLY